jgi:predicted esterase
VLLRTVVGVTTSAGTDAQEILVARAVPYGHGKVLDTYAPLAVVPSAVVLLWHGLGDDQRDVLEPLARATAALGVRVFVPDWQPSAPDGGRAQLLASLSFTREYSLTSEHSATRPGADLASQPGDPGIVLAGWSRGGKAAAGLAVNPQAVDGWRPRALVCLGSGFRNPAPTTGSSVLADAARTTATPVPCWLVHGTTDRVVAPSGSHELAAILTERGWPVQLEEPPTDHSGVVMAEYDPVARRSKPTANQAAIDAGHLAARILRAAATAEPPPAAGRPARLG